MAETVVDELITLLTLEGDDQNERQAGKFSARLDAVKDTAKKVGAVLTGATVVLGVWTKQTAASVDEQGKFADSLDLSFQKLQEFEFAAQRVGGTAGEIRGDMAKLQTQFGGFEDADQTLERLARQFDGLSNRQAQMLGQNFGLSDTTIRLLQRGSEGLESLRQEARDLGGILPDEATEQAAAFQDELTNIEFALGGIAKQATVAVLPAITEASGAFSDFIVENREGIKAFTQEFIEGFLDGFGRFENILTGLIGTISQFIGPLDQMTSGLDTADVVSATLLATLTALGLLLTPLLIKIAAITAIVGGMVLAFEDVATFFEGGESLIGDFFNAFEEKFPALFDLLSTLGTFIKEFVVGLAIVAFEKLIWVLEKALGLVEFAGGALLSLLEGGARLLGFGDDAAGQGVTAQAPAAITNQSAVTSTRGDTNIMVNGAGNPSAVANEVVKRGGLRDTQQILSPGLQAPVMG